MVQAKRIKVDCKTGKQTEEFYEHTQTDDYVEPKGLNFNKLKQVLKDKGVIDDFLEVE